MEELKEIKRLAKTGLETSIIIQNYEINDIFIKILLRTELLLEKLTDKELNSRQIRTHQRMAQVKKDEVSIVAYCFSEYEHDSLYPNHNQTEAFELAAQKLDIKKNTLSNIRDAYDGHNNSHRRGWYLKPLGNDLERVKDVCSTNTKEENIRIAKDILGL